MDHQSTHRDALVVWLRDAPWLNRERIRVYPRLLLAAYVAVYAIWLVANIATSGPRKPIGADFASFWAASAATLLGHPSSVYDLGRHHEIEMEVAGKGAFVNPWYYPPMFLLIVLPMALAPYLVSLAAWLGITIAGYLYVVWKIVPRREAIWLAVAFPGAAANIANGQNGFLTFALMGGGLLLLETYPIAAGILFGLMAYKPQMGVMLPIVLVATGHDGEQSGRPP
jgi:alpha-1,2-mannosyltransferase